MPPDPAPAAARRSVTQLDHRIEVVTGQDVDTLWTYRDRSILDEPHARLVDRHRDLAKAETGVIFHRTLLHHLASGEFPVDEALFERIHRTVDQLEEAADIRHTAAREVLAALEPIEATAQQSQPDGHENLSAADQAALLSIAGGAKVHARTCSPSGCPCPPPQAPESPTPTCSGSKPPVWSAEIPATP